MSRLRWRLNTLAGWLMANIMAAIGLLMLLNALVILFVSVWTRPGLDGGVMLEQMSMVQRAVDATPVDRRADLLAAISSRTEFGIHWYPNRASVPIPSIPWRDNVMSERMRKILGQRAIEGFDPHQDDPGTTGQTHYVLAMQLDDGTWLAFDTATRIWGLAPFTQIMIIILFALFSGIVVAAFASRRLSRPMNLLAGAAERFGADVQAPAIRPEGPLEIQVAMRAFNEMQGRIQRFVRDRTEMLAAISHDLRAPLTRMRLRGEYIDDSHQQRRLFNDVDEMRAMVDAALAFFRGDGEEEPMTRFDMTALVQTVIDDSRDEGAEVNYEGPERMIYEGRPKALKRALVNLVGNAVRYGGATCVFLDEADGQVRVRVVDHGPGIPEALHETVFRPFFRAEGSRNRHTGGVGLGLPTARNIVRGHGGDITLRNLNEGLEASLWLPKSPRPT